MPGMDRFHVLSTSTLIILFTAMSNLPISWWVLTTTTIKSVSSILDLREGTGTRRLISTFCTRKTVTLLGPPHSPQSTITWVLNDRVVTIWNPSPMFSFTSFAALFPGLAVNLQLTHSGAMQPSSGAHLSTSWALCAPMNLVCSLVILALYALTKNLTTLTYARSSTSSSCVKNINMSTCLHSGAIF